VLVIASNPVDVLTYQAWRVSGLPANRVVGTGTTLDTTRLRKEVAAKLAIDPRNIHGYIIGEHGDSEVAVWSHTTRASPSALSRLTSIKTNSLISP